ncbi:hypothetical protein [Paraburkholderia antibiotica]|uniref:Uncharacterized protein n=1 Tax=Paraburkholderia antibiotica TaxID=2728839 RepID=A0A7X9X4X0_9BURK|nr:hypothetical protein [Paraburkholderia antibiotica]NML31428.1 hypothetical protein [Paraburkholderia antibiotica]
MQVAASAKSMHFAARAIGEHLIPNLLTLKNFAAFPALHVNRERNSQPDDTAMASEASRARCDMLFAITTHHNVSPKASFIARREIGQVPRKRLDGTAVANHLKGKSAPSMTAREER